MRRRPARMLSVVAGVLALLSVVPCAAYAGEARITEEKRIAPRVVELTISTPAFTTSTRVQVDLPAGYDEDPGRRWPVTYFLAGTMNTYRSFNEFVDGVGLTAAYPSIVVSPNGDSGYWSDWYNGGASGPPKYETYVIDQLLPLIDAHFRTDARRSQRAVLGVSMGGYGSLMVAARHPDLFVAAASLSGAVDSNLAPQGHVLSLSPTFQGGQPDAIYGPRSSQEIRWRGHNPTDLARNLRGLDLQVRTANGIPNPGGGEPLVSADNLSCVVEAGVHMASVSLHDTLDAASIPHLWKDYGPGCHTAANFTRELTDTFQQFARVFGAPPAPPTSFDYSSIEPAFGVWDWTVRADRKRALEFLDLTDVREDGLTVRGSGTTTVTTPPLFAGLRSVDLRRGSTETTLTPDRSGRLRFSVDLGPAHLDQQDTPASRAAGDGSEGYLTARTVRFAPHAVLRLTRARRTRAGARVCVRTLGPALTNVRVSLRRRARGRRIGRARRLQVRASTRCLRFTVPRRLRARRYTVHATGRDRFAHHVAATVRTRGPRR